MPTFTRPDGGEIHIRASDVTRVRPTVRNEIQGHTGSAIFKPMRLVMETVDVVGARMKSETASFTFLHAPNGATVWFDANKVKDAQKPKLSEASPNVGAVINMAGVRQRVRETVERAQQVIDEARTS